MNRISKAPQAWLVVLLPLLVTIGTPDTALAQGDNQLWTAWVSHARLNPDWRLTMVLQDRRGDGGTTAIVRPHIGWFASPALSIHQGYDWVPRVGDKATRHEHRLWQQAVYRFGVGPVKLIGRARLEERTSSTGDDWGLRGRAMVRAMWALPRLQRFGLVASDHWMTNLNTTDWGARSGLDQHRLFVGFAATAGKKLRVEAGYLRVDLFAKERT
ncbi:MAG: DUF2490 domain-containing protein, partial [Myxococcales bacterium]|nr:DUF2490 domain-containing protein [Myxococcales bacterium]